MSYNPGSFKHLLGRPYIEGLFDCYGLLVDYYWQTYFLKLQNFARPAFFWEHEGLNLIQDLVWTDGWKLQNVNARQLEIGDGLVFSVASNLPNHLGVYVGNGLFIHHMFGRFSCEDSIAPKWSQRLLNVYRHDNVVERNKVIQPGFNLAESPLLSPEWKGKIHEFPGSPLELPRR